MFFVFQQVAIWWCFSV